MMTTFRLALLQFAPTNNKQTNHETATTAIQEAKARNAGVVCLPECWNTPYSHEYFREYSEPIGGPSTVLISKLAKEHSIYIIAGSIPELGEDGNVYNTALAFDPDGTIIAKHRKMHLFDISVPGKIVFKESDTLSCGDNITVFDTKYCRMSIGICYDMRFPELSRIAALNHDAKLILFPGCFNMTTGPAHWELLLRSRALDNQVYVAACSQARDTDGSYVAWGHSTVCDPWGRVVATIDEKAGVVVHDIDIGKLEEIREQVPVRKQLRSDIYRVIECGSGPEE